MNETERALFDTVVQFATGTRWPSGRRVLVRERRWLVRFLATWVRSMSDRPDGRRLGMAMDLVADDDARLGVLGRGRGGDRVAALYADLAPIDVVYAPPMSPAEAGEWIARWNSRADA